MGDSEKDRQMYEAIFAHSVVGRGGADGEANQVNALMEMEGCSLPVVVDFDNYCGAERGEKYSTRLTATSETNITPV
jgi:hypothetical protein